MSELDRSKCLKNYNKVDFEEWQRKFLSSDVLFIEISSMKEVSYCNDNDETLYANLLNKNNLDSYNLNVCDEKYILEQLKTIRELIPNKDVIFFSHCTPKDIIIPSRNKLDNIVRSESRFNIIPKDLSIKDDDTFLLKNDSDDNSPELDYNHTCLNFQKRLSSYVIKRNSDMILTYLKIGVVGVGVVGLALVKTLLHFNKNVVCYDKFSKSNDINFIYRDKLDELMDCDMLFLCLPTLYDDKLKTYNTSAIKEVLKFAHKKHFAGEVVIKSTVTPGTCDSLQEMYNKLNIVHNPEFLTARRALEDSMNPQQIVVGYPKGRNYGYSFTECLWDSIFPKVRKSIATCFETELMKIACNSFYAVKIQYFNEIASLCNEKKASFCNVRKMMLNNGWIYPNHTYVPGPDGNLSYGGMCLIKDSLSLYNYLKDSKVSSMVMHGTVLEQKEMRTEATDKPVLLHSTFNIQRSDNKELSSNQVQLMDLMKGDFTFENGKHGNNVDINVILHEDSCFSMDSFYKVFKLSRSVPDDYILIPKDNNHIVDNRSILIIDGYKLNRVDSDNGVCRIVFNHRFTQTSECTDKKYFVCI